MAVINFSKRLFEREIGRLDERMEEKIALFGTPIEEVKRGQISLEVSANRPDLLSYSGFRRAFTTFLGRRKGLKNYKINKPEKKYKVNIENSVKKVRPYTACAIIRGLRINEDRLKEIIELQEKLHFTLGRRRKKVAIGIYPLEKIKLPITYTAIEPDKIKFVPLGSNRSMSGLEVLQKHPTGKEYSSLLAGKEKFPVFLDSNKKILSLPPIINSQEVGRITEKTKEIFIECSGFDLKIIKKCLNIIVSNLAEMGGRIYSMKMNYGKTPSLNTEKRKISPERIEKLLGIKISEKELKFLLEKMGYNYNKQTVEIPAYRIDILHEVDLIEDIAIAYGYNNFIPEIPKISTIGKENRNERIKRKISEVLVGLKLIEVSNYHLTRKEDQGEKMNIPEKSRDLIQIENSKTDYNLLRQNLSSGLLKNLSENTDSEYPQKIFELGKIFYLEKNEIKERNNLAIALAPGNYTELKQIIEYLFRTLDEKISIKEAEKIPTHFIDGRTGRILFDKRVIGYLGEIHPKILKNWKIKVPVSILEISIEEILKELKKKN